MRSICIGQTGDAWDLCVWGKWGCLGSLCIGKIGMTGIAVYWENWDDWDRCVLHYNLAAFTFCTSDTGSVTAQFHYILNPTANLILLVPILVVTQLNRQWDVLLRVTDSTAWSNLGTCNQYWSLEVSGNLIWLDFIILISVIFNKCEHKSL
jgi:hypothetical protein